MKQCAIIPKVRNKENEVVDSKLFKDLLSYTNDRGTTVLTYIWAVNKDFSKYNDSNKFDENGQPTIEFIDRTFGLHNVVEDSKITTQIAKKEGFMNRDGSEHVFMKEMEALDKAKSFNLNNTMKANYEAKMIKFMTGDKGHEQVAWKVRIQRRTALFSLDSSNQEYNAKLNEKIRTILSKFGVSAGALTELQRRMGISGIMDSNDATRTADGLIQLIRLADGIEGEKALPEEFAHFVVEALQEQPLTKRLMNLIIDNNIAKEVLGEEYQKYDDLYASDKILLAKEAIGKLLAKNLLENQSVRPKGLSILMPRWISNAINWLKGKLGMANELIMAKDEVNKELAGIATGILDGSLYNQMNMTTLLNSPVTLYQVQTKLDREKKLLNTIIKAEIRKKDAFEEKKTNGAAFQNKQISIINKLEQQYQDAEYVDGIYTFLEHSLDEMTAINNRLISLRNDPDYLNNINKSASVIRDASNYAGTYASIIKQLRTEMRESELSGDNTMMLRLNARLSDVENLINNFSSDFITLGKPLLAKYLGEFMPSDRVEITQGKDKGKVMTIEDIIEKSDSDLGFFDRWIFAMADSKDPILKLLDLAVKKSHSNARMRSLDMEKEMKAALFTLEKSGIKNTEWMLSRDSKGNTDGRFISEINYQKYYNAFKTEKARLIKLYTTEQGLNTELFKQAMDKWNLNNREMVDGVKRPKLSIYRDEVFANLTPAQKKYYDTVMTLKKEMDNFLPTKYTKDKLLAPQIRKDLVERAKDAKSLKEVGSTLSESIKDQFVRREDDSEYGHAHIDLKGEKINFLPVYYTKKLDNTNDISADITSTMIAYAAMAIDYDEMNKVIDLLELSKQIVSQREVTQTKNGKPIIDKLKSMGRTIEEKLTKEGENSRIMEKLNSFFDSQVYGRSKKDEGTPGKSLDNLNKYTSVANLGLNLMQGISNVNNGVVMINIEAVAKEFFKASSLAKSDKNYALGLGDVLLDIGKRTHTSKIALFNEHLNTIQGEDGKLKDLEMSKSLFARMMGGNALFFLSHCGEHWIQTRTGLAMAEEFKMKSPTGEIVGLYDAMEVIPMMENGVKVGAKLEVKKGYTKEDGTKYTEQDRFKLENKILTVNRKLNGSYNKADMGAIQQYSVGRAAFLFRKWMVDSFNRRFQASQYDFGLQSEYEGYYNTTGHFIAQLYHDIRGGQMHLLTRWNELTNHQRANMLRSFTEVGTLLAITMALSLVKWSDDPDRPWLEQLTEYQLRRLKTEIGAVTPNTALLGSAMTLLKSPTAGVDAANRILNILKITTWFDELQSGNYKGHIKLYKYTMDAIPVYRSINRAIYPKEGNQFLKTQ